MAQLAQRFGLDLTNALTGHGKMLSDFFQSMFRSGSPQTKPHLDYLLLARRQRRQHFVGDLAQVRSHYLVGRIHDRFVFDEIAEMRIFFFTNRSFERDRLLRNL